MTKRCSKCDETKSLEDFYRASNTASGRQAYCKPCAKSASKQWTADNPARHAASKYDWYQRNRDSESEKQRYRKYRVGKRAFDELRSQQGNCCAICKSEFSETPRVDHCHETGRVRGLLCRQCNSGIGFLRDDPVLVSSAIVYLQTR